MRELGVKADDIRVDIDKVYGYFKDERVSKAYAQFEKDGYSQKLQALTHIAMKGISSTRNDIFEKYKITPKSTVLISLFIAAVKFKLFTYADGDIIQAIYLMITDEDYKASIDETYEAKNRGNASYYPIFSSRHKPYKN